MSRNADITIATARLVLRGPRPCDFDALHAIYGDARAMRYWSTPPDKTRDETAARLQRQIAGFAARPTYFVIEQDGIAIGNAGMTGANEIGFILHRDQWRKGIGREALSAILPYIWQTTDVSDVIADADPDNDASVGLLQAMGFAQTHRAENTFFIDGVWSHSVYFRLCRPAARPGQP